MQATQTKEIVSSEYDQLDIKKDDGDVTGAGGAYVGDHFLCYSVAEVIISCCLGFHKLHEWRIFERDILRGKS